MLKVVFAACLMLGLLATAPVFAQDEEGVGLGAPAAGPVTHAAPVAFLTNILRQFKEAFAKTTANAVRGGGLVAVTLFSFCVSRAAAQMALRVALAQYIWQLCIALVYTLLALNPWIATWFVDSLAGSVSGEVLGGSALSNPSLLITKAWEVTTSVFTQGMQDTHKAEGFVDTLKAAASNTLTGFERAPIILAGLLVVFGYWWTAVVGMKAVVYAHARTLVGITLCPLMILPITRPIGNAGISLIVAAAIELGVQSAIVGVGFTMLQAMHLDANSDFQAVLETGLGCCAVAWLCSGLTQLVSSAVAAIRLL